MRLKQILSTKVLVLTALICGCGGCQQERAVTPDASAGLALLDANLKQPGDARLSDQEIRQILEDNVGLGAQADGLVAGIVDERGARAISAGKAGDGSQRGVDGDTLFEIGSITKVFTALLLQDMVERGDMRLDDPVQLYLPESCKMPMRNEKQITLFDLATHTSGLPRDWSNLGGPTGSVDQLYAALARYQLTRDPGAAKEYSNLGVGLLGHVIARKAGKSYEMLVVERICQPLAMESTRITLTPELMARMATGHNYPARPVAYENSGSILVGAGELKSTANDILKFVSANLGLTSTPLTPLMQRACAEQRLPSGRTGRLIWEEDSGILMHSGLVGGFRANLGFDAARKRGAVILANCSTSRIVVPILKPLLIGISPRPPRTAAIAGQAFDNYVGQYQYANSDSTCVVRREGDRLLMQNWHGKPRYPMPFLRYELFPQSESVYFSPMWDSRVTFVRDDTGQAKQLIIDNPREGISGATAARFSKLPPEPPAPWIDPRVYDGYVGQFRAAFLGLFPIGPTLNLYRRADAAGEHLMAYVQAETGALKGELCPFSETIYFNPELDERCSIVFVRNEAGKATSLLVQLNGKRIRGIRVSDHPVLPPP